MLEDDAEVAAYRDAVLWHGALVRLSPREAVAVCKSVLLDDGPASCLIAFGLFVMGEKDGALLAIPRDKALVKSATTALRAAGLKTIATRISRAAR